MLYDNAQILDLLALDHARAKNPLYRDRALETVGWLRREMTTADGAFSSSLDADAEGEEGKFYVWSRAEIDDALGAEDAAFFAAKYDITAAGNFEGHNIPNRLGDFSDKPEEAARLAALRGTLQQRRDIRIRPGLDDKILADWNGLMIAALANAARAFDAPDWLDDAKAAFDFIATTMTRDGRLGHSWRAGGLVFPGLASDYAAMIRAGLALHEATGEGAWLAQAINWHDLLEHHHADTEHGGYFLTADDAEGLIVRPHSTVDDAIPNHNGLIAQNLVRLAVLTGDERYRAKADAMLAAILPRAADNLFGHLSLLNALDMRLTASEIVIVGTGAEADALLAAARRLPHANRIIRQAGSGEALASNHPAQAKLASLNGTAAFVCSGQTCSLPVTDPDALTQLAGFVAT
jgi:uncharacterized protein YyaL (SSP411 family)